MIEIANRAFSTYPYLTLRDIWYQLYAPIIEDIFQRLLSEVYQNLSTYSIKHRRPLSFFQPQTSVIRQLESSPCFAQIVALHMSGLGDKLSHAFAWVFDKYKRYEQHQQLTAQRLASN